jgi:hypothetical protein
MTSPNDIRRFFSSPRAAMSPNHQTANANTPPHAAMTPNHHANTLNQLTPLQYNWRTRRRIIESDDEDPTPEETMGIDTNVRVQHVSRVAGRDDANRIVICSSEDDLDTSRLSPSHHVIRHCSEMEEHQQEQSDTNHLAETPHNGRQRQATSPTIQRCRRSRYEELATEESTELTDDDECVESDTDAEDLYRSAVLGVRNARIARQHLRARTATCPVCAKFATFLQHFL